MSQIIPIRDLKNTAAISELCHKEKKPVFITKNGYGDMVLMSIECYNEWVNSYEKSDVYSFNELIRILFPIFKEFKVKSAVLFGSYAKGVATEKSDIDILVDSGLHGLKFYGLLDAVCEATKKDIDLIDVREVEENSQIDLEIKSSGVRIYG